MAIQDYKARNSLLNTDVWCNPEFSNKQFSQAMIFPRRYSDISLTFGKFRDISLAAVFNVGFAFDNRLKRVSK